MTSTLVFVLFLVLVAAGGLPLGPPHALEIILAGRPRLRRRLRRPHAAGGRTRRATRRRRRRLGPRDGRRRQGQAPLGLQAPPPPTAVRPPARRPAAPLAPLPPPPAA